MVVPQSDHLTLVGAAIGTEGDMVVTWQTATRDCATHPCQWGRYTTHAARELAATPGWVDFGPLTHVSEPNPWVVGPVTDGSGRAGLLLQASGATALQATRQNASGVWGRTVPAYTDTSGGTPTLWGASIGEREQATYAAIDLNTTNSVLVGDGDILAETWNAPVDLSVGDPSPPGPALAYGNNKTSGAALVWIDLDNTVRATLRTTGSSAFVPTQTVAAGITARSTAMPAGRPWARGSTRQGTRRCCIIRPTRLGRIRVCSSRRPISSISTPAAWPP